MNGAYVINDQRRVSGTEFKLSRTMADVQTETFRPTGLLQIEESTGTDPISTMEESFVPNGLLGDLLAKHPLSDPPHFMSTTTTSLNGLSNSASAESGEFQYTTIIRRT